MFEVAVERLGFGRLQLAPLSRKNQQQSGVITIHRSPSFPRAEPAGHEDAPWLAPDATSPSPGADPSGRQWRDNCRPQNNTISAASCIPQQARSMLAASMRDRFRAATPAPV